MGHRIAHSMGEFKSVPRNIKPGAKKSNTTAKASGRVAGEPDKADGTGDHAGAVATQKAAQAAVAQQPNPQTEPETKTPQNE